MRDQENIAKQRCSRSRGGQIGEISRPQEFRRTDHPVCGASEASRLFINAADTPPLQGGECVRTETVCRFIHIFIDCRYSSIGIVMAHDELSDQVAEGTSDQDV